MTQPSGAENSTTLSADFSNPHTFRLMSEELSEPTPSVRVTSAPQRTTEELTSIEPTFTQHELATKVPFVASYYRIDSNFSKLDASDKQNIRAIDLYVRKQIDSGKYQDSAEAAGEIIKELEKHLKLTDGLDPFYKSERIVKYLETKAEYDRHQATKARYTKEMHLQSNDKVQRDVKAVVKEVKAISDQQQTITKQMKDLATTARLLLLNGVSKGKQQAIEKLVKAL